MEAPQYAWDTEKREENLRKPGLDFVEATAVFQSLRLTAMDTREDYGENRWCSIGLLQGQVVALVHTDPYPEQIRVISLRKATHHERTQVVTVQLPKT